MLKIQYNNLLVVQKTQLNSDGNGLNNKNIENKRNVVRSPRYIYIEIYDEWGLR